MLTQTPQCGHRRRSGPPSLGRASVAIPRHRCSAICVHFRLPRVRSARWPHRLVLDADCRGKAASIYSGIARAKRELPIIFITGHGDIPMSVQAMKGGAIEFLTKPFRDQDLLDAIQLGLSRDRAWRENEEALADLRDVWPR